MTDGEPESGVATSHPIEIRVHGVGDHKQWSAMGRPQTLVDDPDNGSALFAAPRQPAHTVELFNWSRVTRRVVRSLWYVAFPYTLLNVARQMTPDGARWLAMMHAVFVRFASLVLTLLTAMWVFSAAENAALFLNRDQIFGVSGPPALLRVSAAILIGIALLRAVRNESPEHARSSVAHAGVVLAVLVASEVWRFSRLTLDHDSILIVHSRYGIDEYGMRRINEYLDSEPSPDASLHMELLPHLDVLGLVTYVCLLSVLAFAFVVTIAGASRRNPKEAAPLIGSAASVVLSFLLGLLTLTAVFGSLPTLISRQFGWVPQGQGFSSEGPDIRVLPYFGRSAADVALPLVVLALILIFLVAFLISARFQPGFLTGPAVHAVRSRLPAILRSNQSDERQKLLRRRRLEWSHDVVAERLSTVLSRSLLLFFIVTCAGGLWLALYFSDRAYREESQGFIDFQGAEQIWALSSTTSVDRAVAVGVGLSVAVGFWILTRGTSGPLKGVLASMGDVAGFWPITISPYGGRNYREAVVTQLEKIVEGSERGRANVVLVGHSQGSVLAAWYAERTAPSATIGAESPPPIAVPQLRGMVTCGSPLVSLYARFFPATFTAEFFAGVRRSCVAWENFWRSTDPIATAVGPPADDHDPLDDPLPDSDGTPNGHSDYWIDPTQTAAVARLVASRTPRA